MACRDTTNSGLPAHSEVIWSSDRPSCAHLPALFLMGHEGSSQCSVHRAYVYNSSSSTSGKEDKTGLSPSNSCHSECISTLLEPSSSLIALLRLVRYFKASSTWHWSFSEDSFPSAVLTSRSPLSALLCTAGHRLEESDDSRNPATRGTACSRTLCTDISADHWAGATDAQH